MTPRRRVALSGLLVILLSCTAGQVGAAHRADVLRGLSLYHRVTDTTSWEGHPFAKPARIHICPTAEW